MPTDGRASLLEVIRGASLIAIIRLRDLSGAVMLARALLAGGINVLDIFIYRNRNE